MEFYLSIDGKKTGPVSIFRVSEMLDAKEISGDTLGWHRDLDGWKPLREIPSLDTFLRQELPKPDPPFLPEEDAEAVEGMPPLPDTSPDAPPSPAPELPREVRPFVRFWARMFDYSLVSVVVLLLSDYSIPQPVEGESTADLFARYMESMRSPEALALAKAQIVALIGWHVLEAFLIHFLGTTPGKALLGIRVVSVEGHKLSVIQSLTRSFFVYVFGMGLHISVLPVIAMTFSFFRLMATGNCLWDQQLKVRVESCRLGPLRIVLAIFVFFGLLLLQSLKFS
jgi:uncharacterized RDD family membrane protein YckC